MRFTPLLFLSLLFALVGAGCASVSPYSERSSEAYNAYAWGATEKAAQSYSQAAQEAGRNEKLLWELETAKAYQASGDYALSQQWFSQAESTLRGFEDEAVIKARDWGNEAVQLITNPNTLAYKGLFTDRIFLNTYQALNFLALRDLEGAAVESRRALYRQDEALGIYADQIARMRSGKWTEDENRDRLQSFYASADASLNASAMRFANPVASWLRAIIHHMRGDFDKAAFDLNQVLADGISTQNLRRYADALNDGSARETRWCFVVFENGRGPTLKEDRLELLLPKLGFTAISLPKPYTRPIPYSRVSIEHAETSETLDTLTTTDALFSAEFKALFPGILARTLAQYTTKEVIARGLVNNAQNDSQKTAAYILSGLYKYFTARSDTRTWQTRGNAFMVAAIPLHSTEPITVRPVRRDGGPVRLITLTPEPGKHLFAYIQGLNPGETESVQQAFD